MLLRNVLQQKFKNLGGISFVFSNSLSQNIKETPIPMAATGVDRISWCSSPNGEFDLKGAYNLACADITPPCMSPSREIGFGKFSHYPRLSAFYGNAFIKVFLAREILGAKGLSIPISCPLCNAEVESIIHILRDCPLARGFWDSFPVPIHPNTFYGVNLMD